MPLVRLLRILVGLPFFLIIPDCLWAQGSPPHSFKAVAFDYFVIFNPDSVIPAVEREFPGKGRDFTQLWRSRQFDYGFLRSLTHRHEDFLKVTDDALVYTAAALHLKMSAGAHQRLLDAYLHLTPWPDAAATLRKLRAAGLKVITLANFSPRMLRSNAEGAGIAGDFDVLLSTEENGTFKPEPAAYELGMKTLGLRKQDILFVAFGGWDAYGAKSFGYTTYWVNRFGLPPEELGLEADAASPDLKGLLAFLSIKP